MKHSKRFLTLKNSIKLKSYPYKIAIDLLKTFTTSKFVESVEAHIALNLIVKNITHHVRSQLIFPYGTGKKQRIAVFDDSDNNAEFLNFGASIVGIDNILKQIADRKIDFDILITTPLNMPKLLKFGKILGPKGLMPNPNLGTITSNIKESILLFKNGKMEYKTDKMGVVHVVFGKLNFPNEQLIANLHTLYLSIIDSKPIEKRGNFIKSFTICSTMSPSIFLDLQSFKLI